MPPKIQIMPQELAQTIAAGEVVERPASIVKELIENAIDAGSTEITVELENGGLQLIRVYDNGEGIEREDLPVALHRYATSKLKKAEDLYQIRTLGFRGEALPSIASVSQMVIKTRVAHSIQGNRLLCEGGEIKRISEIGCPVGTEVVVKNLLYNLPVKRKFLKPIPTEFRHALSHFLKLSLVSPCITFRFLHDGRLLYEHPKTENHSVRIEAVLGREIYDHLKLFAFENEEIRISGFASLPSLLKGNGEGITIYVNQRYIKDRFVYRAVLEAYRHVIPAGKYPVVVLFLTIPPSAVDVNVHPTKAEVKFREPDKVFQAVNRALRSVQENGFSLKAEKSEGAEEAPVLTEKEPAPTLFEKTYPTPSSWMPWNAKSLDSIVREKPATEWKKKGTLPIRLLGQVDSTFLICEGKEGVIFIDQHAAHERILFEKFKKEYETKSVALTRFLIPIQMTFSAEESLLLESLLETFRTIGFEIDLMGKQTFAIRSMPSLIDQEDTRILISEMLDEISLLNKGGNGAEALHAILITLACRAAVKGNYALKSEEAEGLLAQLAPFQFSLTCPHGRPVFFLLPFEALKRQFKRK
jgi:DNA mismatch repair protein MutL